jgi:hypothetical protein
MRTGNNFFDFVFHFVVNPVINNILGEYITFEQEFVSALPVLPGLLQGNLAQI